VRGTIKQVAHTYGVVQLITSTSGDRRDDLRRRSELENKEGLLHYWTLMRLALQRAKTAREAIQVMTSLVDEYGYASTGESFSIADTKEAWLMEMIGPGPGGKARSGGASRARRVHLGHANASRIGEFPSTIARNASTRKT